MHNKYRNITFWILTGSCSLVLEKIGPGAAYICETCAKGIGGGSSTIVFLHNDLKSRGSDGGDRGIESIAKSLSTGERMGGIHEQVSGRLALSLRGFFALITLHSHSYAALIAT